MCSERKGKEFGSQPSSCSCHHRFILCMSTFIPPSGSSLTLSSMNKEGTQNLTDQEESNFSHKNRIEAWSQNNGNECNGSPEKVFFYLLAITVSLPANQRPSKEISGNKTGNKISAILPFWALFLPFAMFLPNTFCYYCYSLLLEGYAFPFLIKCWPPSDSMAKVLFSSLPEADVNWAQFSGIANAFEKHC